MTSRRILPRYLIVGMINSFVTFAIFLVTALKFTYVISYLISYSVGILLNLYFQPKSVFQMRASTAMRRKLIMANLVTISVGVLINQLLDSSSISPFFAAIVTFAFTLPVGFLLTKKSLLGNGDTRN